MKECKVLRWLGAKLRPTYVDHFANSPERRQNPEASALFYVLSEMEDTALICMAKYYGVDNVNSIHFDGVLLKESPCNTADISQAKLPECEEYVARETGIRLSLAASARLSLLWNI